MKRNQKSILDKKILFLCRKIVMKRDNGMCRVPGCARAATDTIHIIDRDVSITRYDLSNLYAGCRFHHNHSKPLELIQQHIEVVGKDEVFRLCKLAQEYKCWRLPDLELLRDELKKKARQ